MPMRPRSPSFATISYGKLFVRSSSSATGAISERAKSRTVCWISRCSGESSKSTCEVHEQAHSPAAGALADVVAVVLVPRDAGDVEVRARPAVYELLEERGGVGGRRLALLGHVHEVGDLSPRELLVVRMERQ